MWNRFNKKQEPQNHANDKDLWNDRLTALESLFGKSDDVVGHAVVPFFLGVDAGGAADVVYFKSHFPGRLAVTADLIGCGNQKRNSLGNYELAIAHRDSTEDWGANLIARLANYTLNAVLEPGETMDIGPAVPQGSTIDALLFFEYSSCRVRNDKCGILLCVGITQDEKAACMAGRRKEVENALKTKGVFPYTDMIRKSTL